MEERFGKRGNVGMKGGGWGGGGVAQETAERARGKKLLMEGQKRPSGRFIFFVLDMFGDIIVDVLRSAWCVDGKERKKRRKA